MLYRIYGTPEARGLHPIGRAHELACTPCLVFEAANRPLAVGGAVPRAVPPFRVWRSRGSVDAVTAHRSLSDALLRLPAVLLLGFSFGTRTT